MMFNKQLTIYNGIHVYQALPLLKTMKIKFKNWCKSQEIVEIPNTRRLIVLPANKYYQWHVTLIQKLSAIKRTCGVLKRKIKSFKLRNVKYFFIQLRWDLNKKLRAWYLFAGL